ncbi:MULTISPECIES: glycosyltransferase [Halomonadaceae]|uniref:Glycosyltransferase n=1 Tax=Vreelandella halophila TaxID=86177 RepID=A0A9X4YAJ8_9GAMM|nr:MULTISPECIES: glycosyltransferase [Halomonas]MYL26184.1 glycosyltransferase [Halomonas utahensis]MYL73254.1 glycosyltransferase [Halomonas sp. 22501_18_FS]
MPPLVSVLIPAYNVAPYIREAVDSIINQTYTNLEIIITNDGSTDDTLKIAQEYTEDPRVKVFSQENQGLSSARNNAIARASGEYIYHFDSDDVLEPSAIEECVDHLVKDDLDIIGFSGAPFIDDSIDFNFKTDRYQRDDTPIMSGQDFIETYIESKTYATSVCLYLSRKNIVTDNNIQFIDRIPHQDETYTFDIFYHARRVKCLSNTYFRRRYRIGSVMTSKKSEVNARALLKVNAYFEQHYYHYPPGQHQIKKLHRRISQVIMKNNLPYSVMEGFDFSIPFKYWLKYLPKRIIAKLG